MPAVPDPALILSALHEGEIHLQGQFVWGSNSTFLVNVVTSDLTFPAIYKPVRGERPLYDFPAASLSHREVAAFFVSEALGWRSSRPRSTAARLPTAKAPGIFIPMTRKSIISISVKRRNYG